MKKTTVRSGIYHVISWIILILLALAFLFPLYWIVTGAFKNGVDINNTKDIAWVPSEWVLTNFEKLFNKRTAPLFEIFGIEGPRAPAAFRWLLNTVVMAVSAMLLTCITASMAGYSLAKKRFR